MTSKGKEPALYRFSDADSVAAQPSDQPTRQNTTRLDRDLPAVPQSTHSDAMAEPKDLPPTPAQRFGMFANKWPRDRQVLVLIWVQTVVQFITLLGLFFGGISAANALLKELKGMRADLTAMRADLNTTAQGVNSLASLNPFG